MVVPPVVEEVGSVDQTAFVQALVIEDPLPFTDEPTTPPELAGASISIDAMGMTGEVPAILVGNETLPFMESGALGIDDELRNKLTIEQYASLCAELLAAPSRRAQTLQRYGADDNTFDMLEQIWNERFDEDPNLRARYEQLHASYRDWLTRNRS